MKAPRNTLLEGPILRSLLTLAIPIVAANILQSAYQLIDAFWVGRLGGAAVAAVSITFPVMFLMFAVGAGLSIAGSTLIAQFVGAGNHKMVGHIAGQTLLMVIGSAAVLGIVGWIAAPALLRLMGVAPEVYDGALGFMRVSFLGLAFNFSFFVFNAIMRSIGRPNLPVAIVLGTVFLNFVLDPLLIQLSIDFRVSVGMGAALATLFTQAIAAVIGLVVLRRGMHGIHVKMSDFRPDPPHIRRAFLLGAPASLDMSARALGIMVMTFLVASFGTTTLAAYGVGGNILQVVIIPAMGLSMAVSALAGQNIGAGNVARAASIGRLGAALGFGALSALGLLVFCFPAQLVSFFVPADAEVVREGARFLRIMSLTWGFIGVQFAFSGVFRASGNMVLNMMLTVVSLWLLQFPLAYILSKHTSLGAEGIFWSTPASTIVTTLLTACLYMHGGWRKKRLLDDEEVLVGRVSGEILGEGQRQ